MTESQRMCALPSRARLATRNSSREERDGGIRAAVAGLLRSLRCHGTCHQHDAITSRLTRFILDAIERASSPTPDDSLHFTVDRLLPRGLPPSTA